MITIWRRKCLRVLIFAICVVVIWNFVSVYWIMEVRLPTQIQVVIAKKEGEVILVGRKQPKQTAAATTIMPSDAPRPKICENCFHTKFRYIVMYVLETYLKTLQYYYWCFPNTKTAINETLFAEPGYHRQKGTLLIHSCLGKVRWKSSITMLQTNKKYIMTFF